MPQPSDSSPHERLATAGKRLRECAECRDGVAGAVPAYGEAVTAVLLDSMDKYVAAAAKDRESAERDRESQASNRKAQFVLGALMLLATIAMVVSTAIYTAAARKQTQLMERQLTGVAAPSPAASPVPVRSADKSQAPATAP